MFEEEEDGRLWKILVPVLLLGAGAAVSGALVLLQPEPAQRPSEGFEPAVETTALAAFAPPLSVEAHGRVRAAQRVTLVAQVAGEVMEVHPNWLEGGTFSRGDVLVEIDPTRYRAALTQARSNVRATRASLKLAKTQVGRTRRLTDNEVAPKSRLDETVSQRDQLEAQLAAQRASALIAREDLDDATIEAPYDGRFVSLDVDAHQVVSTGTSLGTILRSDVVEAVLPLSSTDAALVSRALEQDVEITAQASVPDGAPIEGRLVSLAAQTDTGAQTVDAIVRFEAAQTLRPGQFVDVTFAVGLRPDTAQGERLVELPASALRRGPAVWIVDEGTLSIEDVEVVHRVEDRVLVSIAAEHAGGELVTSELVTVTDDMPVRVEDRGPSA